MTQRAHWCHYGLSIVRQILDGIFHQDSRQAIDKEDEILPRRVYGAQYGEYAMYLGSHFQDVEIESLYLQCGRARGIQSGSCHLLSKTIRAFFHLALDVGGDKLYCDSVI